MSVITNLPRLTVIAMALVVAGCGVSGAKPAGDVSLPEHHQAEVQSCQSLLDSGWKPAEDDDPTFNIDPETWLVEVIVGEDNFVVDVAKDDACSKLPSVGGPLSNVMSEYEELRSQECASAVDDVLAGNVPMKGKVEGSLDALRHHVMVWCPPSYAEKLREGEAAAKR